VTMPASIEISALAAFSVGAGLIFGYGYFVSLRRSVDLYAARRAWLSSSIWALVRIVAAALFFAALARWGAAWLGEAARQWVAAPLLAAFAGFLVARQLAVRSARRGA
jgi:hypothetical protein